MEEEQEEAASAARRALADAAFASKELEAIKEHAALMAEQLQTAKIVASKAVLQETKTALRLSAGHPSISPDAASRMVSAVRCSCGAAQQLVETQVTLLELEHKVMQLEQQSFADQTRLHRARDESVSAMAAQSRQIQQQEQRLKEAQEALGTAREACEAREREWHSRMSAEPDAREQLQAEKNAVTVALADAAAWMDKYQKSETAKEACMLSLQALEAQYAQLQEVATERERAVQQAQEACSIAVGQRADMAHVQQEQAQEHAMTLGKIEEQVRDAAVMLARERDAHSLTHQRAAKLEIQLTEARRLEAKLEEADENAAALRAQVKTLTCVNDELLLIKCEHEVTCNAARRAQQRHHEEMQEMHAKNETLQRCASGEVVARAALLKDKEELQRQLSKLREEMDDEVFKLERDIKAREKKVHDLTKQLCSLKQDAHRMSEGAHSGAHLSLLVLLPGRACWEHADDAVSYTTIAWKVH